MYPYHFVALNVRLTDRFMIKRTRIDQYVHRQSLALTNPKKKPIQCPVKTDVMMRLANRSDDELIKVKQTFLPNGRFKCLIGKCMSIDRNKRYFQTVKRKTICVFDYLRRNNTAVLTDLVGPATAERGISSLVKSANIHALINSFLRGSKIFAIQIPG